MRSALLALLLFIGGFSSAQNLVPNPSFEDTVGCPTLLGQVTKAKYWYDILNTPDYFHECCTVTDLTIPSNTFGYQYPATGSAYMGAYFYDLIDTNYREMIGAYLTEQLTIGNKYYVTLKVSFSAGIYQAVNIAVNKIGILFTTENWLNEIPVTNSCQVYSDSIISDSMNWVTIRGSFTADSNYAFIAIGNFFQNYLTDTICTDNLNRTRGYYYIEDICVSTDSLYSEVWNDLRYVTNGATCSLYPNPTSDYIFINGIYLNTQYYQIFNVHGQEVFTERISNPLEPISVDVSTYPSSVYIVVFKDKNNLVINSIPFFHN